MQTKHIPFLTWLLGAAFTLCLAVPASAQKTGKVEKEPGYPGGIPALIEFMVQHIQYPEAARKEKAEGMVLLKFTVGQDGVLSDFKTVTEGSQNPRADFVREAVRVVKTMPKWIPAEADGKAVSAEMVLPIKFKLDGDKDKP